MAEIQTIRRNLALKEYEIKETPNGKQVTFSIRFVKKNGELVYIPRASAAGLPFNEKDNRMRGVLPDDSDNNASGHVTPVHIDGIIESRIRDERWYCYVLKKKSNGNSDSEKR